MAVLGEYVSYSNFTVDNGEDFSVTSASLAAGYLYQVNPDWQVIGALVPFYNHSSLGERGKDWFASLGASYSGNRWAIDTGTGKVGLNLSGFDFGFGAGMRLKGPLWLEGAVGVGGLRALTIDDGEVSGPSIDVSSSPFVNISLTFRPSFTD